MKKYVKYFLPVILLGMLLVFHHQVISFSLEQYINRSLPKKKKISLTYRSLLLKKKGLVFTDLVVTSSLGRVETKNVKVGLSSHKNWLKKKIKFQMDSPVVSLNENTKSGAPIGVFAVPLKKLRVDISKGTLLLDSKRPIYFSMEGYQEKKQSVTCHLSTNKDTKQMHIALKGRNALKQANVLFTDLSLTDLDPFLPKIKELKGNLNGAFHITFNRDQECKEFDYHVKMEDLAFSTRAAQYSFRQVMLSDSFSKMPSLKQLWNLLLTSTKIEGGKVVLNQDASEMHFDAAFDIKEPMKIYGHWITESQTHPFAFSGGGNRDYQSSWNVLLENQTGGSLRLSSSKQGYLFFQTLLKDLQPRHVHLLKSSLLPLFPQIDPFEMASGALDLHLNLWMDLQGIMRLEIENLSCKNGSLSYGEMKSEFKKMEGSLYLNGPAFSLKDFSDWGLQVEDATVEAQGITYYDVNISLLMQQKFLLSSFISLKNEQTFFQANLEGLLKKLQISASMEWNNAVYVTESVFKQSELEKILTGEIKATYSDEVTDRITYSLMLNQEKLLSLFSPQGFLDSSPKIEEKNQDSHEILAEDNNSFSSFSSHTLNNAETGFLSFVKEGSFQGKNLHEKSFNLPIALSGVSWKASGVLDIQGRLDEKQLEIRICSNQCGFSSSYIDLYYPENSERISGSFHYHRKEKKWDGFVPLKDAICIEPRFQLEFQDVKGNIVISDNVVTIKELEGVSEGLKLQGETSLKILENDEAEFYVNCPVFSGSSDALVAFMNHFEAYQTLQVPFNGYIEAKGRGLDFFVKMGKNTPPAKWSIEFYGYEGQFALLENVKAEHVSFFLSWDSTEGQLKIRDLFGGLCLFGEKEVREYQLNGKEILFQEEENFSFDIRIENHTHDIFKFLGSLEKIEKGYLLHLDKDHTHLFGSKLKESKLLLSEHFFPLEAEVKLDVSSYDILNHLDFFQSAGILGIKRSIIEDLSKSRMEGAMEMGFSYSKEKENALLVMQSEELLHNGTPFGPVKVTFLQDKSKLSIPECQIGKMSCHAELIKQEKGWDISSFALSFKDSFLKGHQGFFSLEKEKATFAIEKAGVDLVQCKKFFRSDFSDYLEGIISMQGNVEINFPEGLHNLQLISDLVFYCDELGAGKIKLKTTSPFHIELTPSTTNAFTWKVSGGAVKLSKGENWSACSFGTLVYENEMLEGKGFSGILPPEMCLYLAQSEMLPFVSYQEDKLVVWGTPIKWENQIESHFDFIYGKEEKKIAGCIQDGYYWIGDKSWKIDHFTYSYDSDIFDVKLNSLVYDTPLAFGASLKLGSTMTAEAYLQDLSEDVVEQSTILSDPVALLENEKKKGEAEEGSLDKLDKEKALNLQMTIGKEGLSIQSLEGNIFGLEFFFHRNQKRTLPNEMQITGQLKIDPTKLIKALPKEFGDILLPLELGNGYELSGDLVLSREKFKQSYFKGYLKGRHFVFMGSHLKTLLSDVTLETGLLRFDDFKVADEAGFISIKEILFSKEESSDWKVSIPEIEIQDFRPSMLKKIDQYRGKVKPLKICQLTLNNLKGTLGDTSSFVGEGAFRFTNTFKTDFNLFDIPFEIIGRLGLDMGLLVPACGHVDFSIKEGRVYFDSLDESYSEGKRSKFYLSKKRASFIDFSGNMDVNIKMKQYVLLKITEPFTIAIEGSLAAPKYSLR